MNKIFLTLLVMVMAVFSINFANIVKADGIGKVCIDVDPPLAPSNLAVSGQVGNILLTWNAAIDVPACSGIDYYVVSRNGIHIAEHVTALTYTDPNVSYGTYSYSVYAVDKVGHQGASIRNDIILSKPSQPSGGGGARVTGGGAKTSYVCEENWDCSTWSECINGIQRRTCTDLNFCGTTNNKPATSRSCSAKKTQETTSASQGITGAVIGGVTDFVRSKKGITIIASLITIIGAFIAVKLGLIKRK